MNPLTNSEFAVALREANRQGPPQETCKVYEDGKIRPFNDDEDNLIGSFAVAPGDTSPRDLPLYGNEDSGWLLRFIE